MTPNQLQDMASELSALYAQAEERLTAAVARRLARGVEEPGWANRKLEEVQAFRSELTRELETLSRSAAEMRSAMLDTAWDTGESGLTDELGVRLEVIPQARLAGIAAIETELSQKFDALQSAVLRAVDDQYRSIIGQAVAAQATGTITTKQALKQALNAFADRGISGFTDRAGRHWGMAEYSEMAVRTGMMRAAIAGYSADALEHGETLVIVSDHADECPLCRPWERKVLAIAPEGLQHPDCQGTLDGARAAGLFHPNCLHSITVYVPGLTDRTGSKARAGITPVQDERGYANRQQQRSMERTVRKWKRRQAAAIEPEDERIARAYVVKWQRQLRALTGETKLPRKYDREGGRVLLSDAAKKLKAFTVSETGVIIRPQSTLDTILVAGRAVNTKMRVQKQRQHIWNSKEFLRRVAQAQATDDPLPSVFYENVDVDALVRAHMGKGEADIDRHGILSEFFDADEAVGQVYLIASGTYVPTIRVCIRYSKDGWHAFPVKEVK